MAAVFGLFTKTIIGELAPETTRQIMGDIALMDDVFDLISAGRPSIRVKSTKPVSEDSESYFCSFLINVDFATHEKLVAEAQKQQRTVASLLRRYAILAFKMCLEDVEDVKEAA